MEVSSCDCSSLYSSCKNKLMTILTPHYWKINVTPKQGKDNICKIDTKKKECLYAIKAPDFVYYKSLRVSITLAGYNGR